jgi:hypothetical protein
VVAILWVHPDVGLNMRHLWQIQADMGRKALPQSFTLLRLRDSGQESEDNDKSKSKLDSELLQHLPSRHSVVANSVQPKYPVELSN